MSDATLPGRLEAAFAETFGGAPVVATSAPGRVNLVGAHIDYNDGKVLPVAIDRAIHAVAAPSRSADGHWRLRALDHGELAEIDPAHLPPPLGDGQSPEWLDYPRGLVWALREAGLPTHVDTPAGPRGLDIVFAGDVPPGAGVSASAATEVAMLLAWRELAGQTQVDRRQLAALGRTAENGYLHVMSGLMDQLASLFGQDDHAMLIDCRTLEIESLELPSSERLVVFDSGVRRRLAESSFNDRRAECREAVGILQEWLPGLDLLRDLSSDQYEQYAHRLPPTLRRRVRHSVHEMARVDQAADALRAHDLHAFGRLMRRSQASSRDFYEVSVPEIDVLCAAAWATPGCWGARLVGGGFGGCVVALVEEEAVEALQEGVGAAFAGEFGPLPDSFIARAAGGATCRRL